MVPNIKISLISLEDKVKKNLSESWSKRWIIKEKQYEN